MRARMTSKLKPSGNKLGKALEITSGGNPNEYAVKGSIHITLERDIPRPTMGVGVNFGERCIARVSGGCVLLVVIRSGHRHKLRINREVTCVSDA